VRADDKLTAFMELEAAVRKALLPELVTEEHEGLRLRFFDCPKIKC
jgi:hypothetical protein